MVTEIIITGHAHLTDFNVATIVEDDKLATSMSGTKPYMAPEVYDDSCVGYSYPVDWWSLGNTVFLATLNTNPTSEHRIYARKFYYARKVLIMCFYRGRRL